MSIVIITKSIKKTEEANSIIHTLSVVSTLINASMFMSNKNNIIIRFWLVILIFFIQRLHIKDAHTIMNMCSYQIVNIIK